MLSVKNSLFAQDREVALESNELVISEFSGEIQKKILERMNIEYLATGKFVKDDIIKEI